MVIQLYGVPTSTCTQLVMTIFKETNTPFDLIDLNFMNGGTKAPDYVKMQPFGQIPVLVDEDLTMFESRAIARYIAAKANSPLLPTDLKQRALYETAASIETFNFHPYASEIVNQLVFIPFRGGKPDQAIVAKQSALLEAKLAGYEQILGKTKYLSGDEITLADLAHLPYGSRLAPNGVMLLEDQDKFPNVARWWKDISSRSSWQAIMGSI